MEPIWKNLSYDMVREILTYVDDIDVRISFKIPPRKLDINRIWRLEWLLNTHDGIFYNLETETLHNMRLPGIHIIRRPFKLDYYDDGLWVFNESRTSHSVEITTASGDYMCVPNNEPWMTEMRVLLKGSGLARVINFSGSTL